MILKRLILFIGIFFTVIACNNLKGPEKPKNLISKDKMVDILIDAKLITSANSKNKITMRDSSLNINTYVYEKHKIDSLQFALSNNYYAFHVEDYEDIYTRVTDSLERLKAKLKEKEAIEWKAQTKREEDSLEQVSKEKERLKSLTNKDSLGTLIKRDSVQIEDVLIEQSLEEMENLIEPIFDSDNNSQ
tara:strand:- start:2603 stop:3169 length:567 start_codon:yes stop_codon:yes gene_type:complete